LSSSTRNPSRRISILPNSPNLREFVDQMPLTRTKKARRRTGSKSYRIHKKRLDEARAEEDLYRLSSSSGGGGGSSGDEAGASSRSSALSRYQSLLDDRLQFVFALRDGVDITDLADIPDLPPQVDRRLPSDKFLDALTSPAFLEGEMGDALVEYQVYKYLRQENLSLNPRNPGEFQVRIGAAEYSVDDDFTYPEFVQDAEKLISRKTTVDEDRELEPEEVDKRELKEALYRIKALLLLKGKAVDRLDDAALQSKFPPSLIEDNSHFLSFHKPEAFGWYFDPELCQIASLTDYQRLVILNYCGYQYQDWNRYRSHYNTPETDREYLLYWKTITQKIKWVEDFIYHNTSSREWFDIERKAYYQAIRIATDFENIHFDLACLGIGEFLRSTRLHVNNLKDLDGVFFEIWKRVIKEKNVKDCFAKALKEVYDLKMFPSRERSMKRGQEMAEKFKRCTVGITAEVPEPIARELIAQQVREKLAFTWGYVHYASKKLKVAEYIGLIGKAST